MRVIFLEDVPGTADAGEVKEVKNGFARNYLLPRGLAAPATAAAQQRVGTIQRSAETKRVKESGDWQVVADAIAGSQIVVEARVGPTGRLFGAVTGRHIAERLSAISGRALDHHQVLLGEAIHDPGDYDVNVRLYREVQTSVKVSVIPEGYTLEQAAELAAEQARKKAEGLAAIDAAAATREADALATEEGSPPVESSSEGGLQVDVDSTAETDEAIENKTGSE